MLISNAYADTAASSGFSLGSLSSLWPIALMFILVYFLMIRPQRKKQKEQQDMISGLGTGDEILTSGGIIGKVIRVEEAFVVLEISVGNTMIVQKNAIVSMLPKGSIDAMLNGDPGNPLESGKAEEESPAPQETGKQEDAGKSGQSA
ncbi:MAG: preprotein translocase subunit YajC [Oxalobacter sp.]|nr:preprotein translocase subunit YajC [Oxalobacter sp.]